MVKFLITGRSNFGVNKVDNTKHKKDQKWEYSQGDLSICYTQEKWREKIKNRRSK